MGESPIKLGAKIAAAVLVVNFLVVSLAAGVLYRSRLAHEERAALTTQNLAELLRHSIGDHFDHANSGREPAAALDTMFLALKLGDHGSISLRDSQGRMLLRNPDRPDIMPPGSRKLAPEYMQAIALDATAGTYRSADEDGVVRLHAYRQHAHHGFYIDVGVAQQDFLEPWWQEVGVLAVGAAGMLLLSALSGLYIYRSSRQRELADRNIAGLLKENRRLIASLFSANEDQRRKLARDLHDELGQWLAAIQVNARVLANAVAGGSDTTQFDCARTIADSALEINHVIRDMVRMLRPPLLDTMGLKASLDELVAHWLKFQGKMAMDHRIEGDIDHLPEPVSIAVYRILQEALANVTKHAAASAVYIRISNEKESGGLRRRVNILIADNGVGMPDANADPGGRQVGVGLLGIRERAVALGGDLEIAPGQPHGYRLSVGLPVARRPSPGNTK